MVTKRATAGTLSKPRSSDLGGSPQPCLRGFRLAFAQGPRRPNLQ
jgi:hypothetical protein